MRRTSSAQYSYYNDNEMKQFLEKRISRRSYCVELMIKKEGISELNFVEGMTSLICIISWS